MLPELSELKLKRREAHLSQQALAELAGVSQSLIAKVEHEQLIPTYDRVKRIFDVLEEVQDQQTVRAKDVMRKKVMHVTGKTLVKKAVSMMRKSAVSQIPVMEGEKVIGTLSEKEMLHQMQETRDLHSFGQKKVREVMQEAMPLVQENLPVSVISSLLEHYPAVLVGSRGRIQGIVTKSDLLNLLGKR